MNFTEKERKVLSIVQSDLPDTLTPYADIAKEAGLCEEEVLALLQRLKEDGTIRRFGASIKHQKTGYNHNAMVAWKIDEDNVDGAAKYAAQSSRISHCYYRPSSAPDWQYTFFTMIHGRTMQECYDVVEELRQNTCLDEYAVLEIIKELKKISMTYVDE